MFVPPERLREYWPDVRPALERMIAEHDELWLPEDVYADIMAGGANLFTTTDVRGFVVTQFLKTPYSRTLHVWIAHNEGHGRAAGFFEQIKDIARANDCQEVTFESDRAGFRRAIPGIRQRLLYSFRLGD